MPLIIVTGLPSSGKTKTAQIIHDHIRERLDQEGEINRQVKIISDSDMLDWDGRDSIYSSIPKEKELRGWLRSEVHRFISLNHIVILDAAAYIKGFRYELFCLSKEAKTQHCVVERLIDSDLCWRWNEALKRDSRDDTNLERHNPDSIAPGYTKETFDALLMRYEKCDENNRWDSPLFRIISPEDELNRDRLYDVITKEEPLTANKCTSLSSSSTTIYKPSK